MSNTKQILPEDGLIIRMEWLEWVKNWYKTEALSTQNSDAKKHYMAKLAFIENELEPNTTPLTPIVKDAWVNGSACGYIYGDDDKLLKLKSLYLSQPIKLENDEQNNNV